MGWTNLGSNPARDEKFFSFSEMSLPALGPIQPPIQRVPGFLPGGKVAGLWFDHSPPSSAWIKNEWSYTFTSSMCLLYFTMELVQNFRHDSDQRSCHIILLSFNESCLISWQQMYHKEKHKALLDASNGFCTVRLESRRALIKGDGSDVHEP
jgi:hypothetical protein